MLSVFEIFFLDYQWGNFLQDLAVHAQAVVHFLVERLDVANGWQAEINLFPAGAGRQIQLPIQTPHAFGEIALQSLQVILDLLELFNSQFQGRVGRKALEGQVFTYQASKGDPLIWHWDEE